MLVGPGGCGWCSSIKASHLQRESPRIHRLLPEQGGSVVVVAARVRSFPVFGSTWWAAVGDSVWEDARMRGGRRKAVGGRICRRLKGIELWCGGGGNRGDGGSSGSGGYESCLYPEQTSVTEE